MTPELCSISYVDSYLYGGLSSGNVHPRLKTCSRPALKDGKCIIHSARPEEPIEFHRRDAFDIALRAEVKALGVPFVRSVDFSSSSFISLHEIVSAVMSAADSLTAKFDTCVFPTGFLFSASSHYVGFFDCIFGGVQFLADDESYKNYEFSRCKIADIQVEEATFSSLNLHGSAIVNLSIRANADHISMRGASVTGRLEVNSSTIRSLDLAYVSMENWSKAQISGVTHPMGVRVSAVGSALNDATFFGVDWARRGDGRLLLGDEEDLASPALSANPYEAFKPDACQVLTRAAVAQTYRNFIDVFERTRQYDLAEDCFVAAMDVQKEDTHLSWPHRCAILIYNLASRYGSSYLRAGSVLVLLLAFFMCLYSLPPTNVRLIDTKKVWGYSGQSFFQQVGAAILHSIEVSTFIKTPLYETYTPARKLVEAAQIVLVPSQAALLLFAIRRRFKR